MFENQIINSSPDSGVASTYFPLLALLGGAGTVLFMMGLGASVITDPRPAALHRLHDDWARLQSNRALLEDDISDLAQKNSKNATKKSGNTTKIVF